MYKKPDDPVLWKEFQELQRKNEELLKLYNDLLKKYNFLKQDVDIKERKLKQQIRNVENKIPRK
jgi:uncharacterized protein YoxC